MLSGLLAGFAVVWVVASFEHPWGSWVLGWIPAPAVSALCAAACWRTANVAVTPPARRFWRAIGLAEVPLGVGAILNAWLSPNSQEQMALPVLACYLAGAVTALVALLRLPSGRPSSRANRSRWGLDALIVLSTASLFSWYFSFQELADRGWKDNLPLFAVAILGVTSVAMFVFARMVMARQDLVDPQALRLLALGMTTGMVGGAVAPLLMNEPHLSSAQFGLPLSAFLYTLAAHRQRGVAGPPARTTKPVEMAGGPAGRTVRPKRPFSVVPYAAVAATYALLIGTAQANRGDGDRGDKILIVAIGATWLTALVVIRQFAALRDNGRLLEQVDAGLAELRQTQRQLAHQATHDALTGLVNRQILNDEVGQALADGLTFSVVLIDLDDFKAVNDRLGHVVGDEVLVVVSQRLAASVKRDDTIARLGGDEFVLLLRHVDAAAATEVMSRVTDVLDQPIRVGEHDLLVRFSVGIAGSSPGADPTELLRRADLAMYAAKEDGKGRCASYQPGLDAQAASDAQLAADLRRALDRGEFHLLYQPVVALPDGSPLGAEALVRWQHPTRGTVPPLLFIPAAERTGLIVPLGRWVLREACRQAVGWLRGPGATRNWRVGVNISARQLREPGFAGEVAECLHETGLPADRLVIEVTETAVFDNEQAIEELTATAALGVAVALDDFGTGHSSLGLLRTCPVSVLKLDRSFVDPITTDTEAAVIAKALIEIADGLRLQTVAEGIETAEQARHLYDLGYRRAQGYHFARPMPGDDVGRLLTDSVPVPEPVVAAAGASSTSGG